jgi:hypothetical protein
MVARMMLLRSTAILAAFLLASCGEEGTEKTYAADRTRGPVTAIFSCRSGGAELPASACIVGHQSSAGVGGSLKISSGGAVQQYSDYDILDALAASRADIVLREPFSITAQAGGDPSLVLRLEILESGQAIFQDEASEFGIIRTDSNTLSREPIPGSKPMKTTEQKIKDLQDAVAEQTRLLGQQAGQN